MTGQIQHLPTDPDRQRAHQQLMLTIGDLVDHGGNVPCVTGPSTWAWTADEGPAVGWAAAQCGNCPLVRDCASYVTAHPEPSGIWAGLTPVERKKRKKND